MVRNEDGDEVNYSRFVADRPNTIFHVPTWVRVETTEERIDLIRKTTTLNLIMKDVLVIRPVYGHRVFKVLSYAVFIMEH